MKESGFTLLELIISILILSIVVLGSTFLMISVNNQVDTAKHRLQAFNQAQAVVDKLRFYVSEDPDYPTDAGTILPDTATNLSPGQITGLTTNPIIPGINLPLWSYDVNLVSSTDCKMVNVIVTWEEA